MLQLIATNSFVRVSVLVMLFAMVATGVLFVLRALARRATIRKELNAISGHAGSARVASLRDDADDAWSRLVNTIERAGLDLADTKSEALRERMLAAGFESPTAPRLYTLIRLVLVVLVPATLILGLLFTGTEMTYTKLYIVGSISALLALYAPTLVIRILTSQRKEAITNGFPDSLDLLLVCVEAGLGLEAALDRVGRELIRSHPLVARLLITATLQLRAGATREAALRRMAELAGVEEISSFATLLIQSDRLGTSIAQTLRVYAGEMRERRRMRAEEKAHRIPVLISIPLVAFMLPTMIGTLMLPAAVRVVRQMLPAMTGG